MILGHKIGTVSAKTWLFDMTIVEIIVCLIICHADLHAFNCGVKKLDI